MSTKDLEAKLRDCAADIFAQQQIVLTLRQSLTERDALIAALVDAARLAVQAMEHCSQPLAWRDVAVPLRDVIAQAAPLLDAQTPDAAEATP